VEAGRRSLFPANQLRGEEGDERAGGAAEVAPSEWGQCIGSWRAGVCVQPNAQRYGQSAGDCERETVCGTQCAVLVHCYGATTAPPLRHQWAAAASSAPQPRCKWPTGGPN